jgi:glutathione S-transferase
MLELYYAPGSCALASQITLAEAGAEYEAVPLDLLANHQRKPEYLALNPKGRVPALVTDKGVLTENPASLAFVAQSFPDARLLLRVTRSLMLSIIAAPRRTIRNSCHLHRSLPAAVSVGLPHDRQCQAVSARVQNL